MSDAEFRNLPGIDSLLSESDINRLLDTYPRELVVDIARERLEMERERIRRKGRANTVENIITGIIDDVNFLFVHAPFPVINATGVIIHTNLGRAPLSRECIDAMSRASAGYSNLEFDLTGGERGSRHVHIEKIICRVTGSDSALTVNNNAAAVMLALTALARRKEVIVSRGEAVEIGGGFRVPDVMKESGARIVEVGTTNRTYIQDYEQAITEKTAALLRVHTSNFRIEGFTSRVTLDEMVSLADRYNLPLIDDIGSGCLVDTTMFGLAAEPMVQQSISAGVALTCFSGDKLLGGPQAGIIAGQKKYVDRLKKHPLSRALRMDKSRLAGLWTTFFHYAKNESMEKIPVWQMISLPLQDIEKRAEMWKRSLKCRSEIIDGFSMIGGGSLPGESLPTRLLSVKPVRNGKKTGAVNSLSAKLRRSNPPVIARIENDILLFDPRTVQPDEDDLLIKAISGITALIE
jgi:L-seryl-tRNA(Ser) seleniumtransferase